MRNQKLKSPFSRPLTLSELAALPDSEIEYSDIPPVGPEFWDNALLMMPEDWKKPRLTLRLDADIVDFFKALGPRYHIRINEVLRSHMEAMRK